MLFVSGMFRSGTTLLARMLDAHPRIALASDPYLPFFKAFRTRMAAGLGIVVDADAPLGDYYFSATGLALFETIQEASLDVPLDRTELAGLRERIRAYGGDYAPRLMPHLERVTGETYAEALHSMLGVVEEHGGKRGAEVVGFKEVWADEFIPCVARSFPDARFIQIVRDPRAVCASKNSRRPRYPWLFLARQWRKLAALAWSYGGAARFDGRVLRLRYEDLVTEPEKTARDVCDFLGLPYADVMVVPAGWVDGAGRPWAQNTSFGVGERRFDAGAIERWRQALASEEVALVETLCGPEMALHGYGLTVTDRAGADDLVLAAPRVSDGDLAPWIHEVGGNDALTTAVEMAKEAVRRALLRASRDDLAAVDPRVIEGSFLLREVFGAARDALAAGPGLDADPAGWVGPARRGG